MLTARRFYIDKFLFKYKYLIQDSIIDVGGSNKASRGNFELSKEMKKNRKVLNINPEHFPDYLFSIEKSIKIDQKFSTIILTEVIEYVDNLDMVFSNISSLSNEKAILIMTWPWMNSFHGDKEFDLKRYSDNYIKNKLLSNGYEILFLDSNGGIFSVVWDFFYKLNYTNKNRYLRRIINLILKFTFKFFLLMDFLFDTSNQITTGFGLVARKK